MENSSITQLIDETAEKLYELQLIDGPLTLNNLKAWLCKFALEQLEITKRQLAENSKI